MKVVDREKIVLVASREDAALAAEWILSQEPGYPGDTHERGQPQAMKLACELLIASGVFDEAIAEGIAREDARERSARVPDGNGRALAARPSIPADAGRRRGNSSNVAVHVPDDLGDVAPD